MEEDPLGGLDREEDVVRWVARSRGWSGGGGSVAWVAEEMREVLCCDVLCSLSLAGWLPGPRPRGMRRARSSKQVGERERGEREQRGSGNSRRRWTRRQGCSDE